MPALLASASCSPSPDELLTKAKEAYAAHDYAVARLHLAEAAEGAPGNREISLLRAKTALALGDGEGASIALATLAAGKPPQGELAELAAAVGRGDGEGLLAVFERAKAARDRYAGRLG